MKQPRLENAQQVLWTQEKITGIQEMIRRTEQTDHPAREISLITLRKRVAKMQAEIDEYNAYHAAVIQKQAV